MLAGTLLRHPLGLHNGVANAAPLFFQSLCFPFHVYGAYPWCPLSLLLCGCVRPATPYSVHTCAALVANGRRRESSFGAGNLKLSAALKCIPWTEKSFVVTRGTWLTLARSPLGGGECFHHGLSFAVGSIAGGLG